jgi:hypothetical protein
MRVEEETDVKEEDIPVAVKLFTAKVKCRGHFDWATQFSCIPNIIQPWHFTALMIQHHSVF